jgi:hypothetical protein
MPEDGETSKTESSSQTTADKFCYTTTLSSNLSGGVSIGHRYDKVAKHNKDLAEVRTEINSLKKMVRQLEKLLLDSLGGGNE